MKRLSNVSKVFLGWAVVLLLLLMPNDHTVGAAPATLMEDFNAGVRTDRYDVNTNSGLYTVDTDGPTVRITKPANSPTSDWQNGGIQSKYTFNGDFTITVDFRLFNFPLPTGSTYQLNESNLIVSMAGSGTGSSVFEVLRFSDAGAQYIEIWAAPAGRGRPVGASRSSLTSGQYRIQRTGTTMRGSYNSGPGQPFTLLGSDTHASYAGTATVSVWAIQLANVTGGNVSTTPLDIEFDNLTIEAASFNGLECVPPPSGMVSWWPGDGNANDIQDGNHGTLRNGATFVAGKVGQAFSFNGVNSFVEIPDAPNLDITNQLTIDAWIKPTAFVPYVGGGTGSRIVDKITAGSVDGYLLDEVSGRLRLIVGSSVVVSSSSLSLNTWTHVAGVYDGLQLRVFINGVLAGGVAAQVIIPTNNLPVRIGANQGLAFGGNPFNGLIDEVEIYSRALTAAEIQAIYNAGSAGKCKTSCQDALAAAQQQVQSLQTQLATANTTMRGLLTQVDTLTADKAALLTQVDTLTADKAALLTQVDTLTQANQILTGQNATLQGQVTTLQGQVTSLTNANQTLTAQNTALQGQVTTLQGQVTSLTNTNQTLTAHNTALQGQVTTLQGQVTSLTNTNQTLTAQNTALQGQVTALTQQNQALTSGLSNGLGSLEQNLRQVFNDPQSSYRAPPCWRSSRTS